jgi:hypothetical protein
MLTTMNSDSKSDNDGIISHRDYLDYLRSHPEKHETLHIRVDSSHILLGVADDPYSCPLARAIRDSIKCDHCEVWLDSIVIDGDHCDTTNELKEFIDFFDQYGSFSTAEAYLAEDSKYVFTLTAPAGKHVER